MELGARQRYLSREGKTQPQSERAIPSFHILYVLWPHSVGINNKILPNKFVKAPNRGIGLLLPDLVVHGRHELIGRSSRDRFRRRRAVQSRLTYGSAALYPLILPELRRPDRRLRRGARRPLSNRRTVLPLRRASGNRQSGNPRSSVLSGELVDFVLVANFDYSLLIFWLFLKARDAYYSGQPLIVDDMFDKVEVKFCL